MIAHPKRTVIGCLSAVGLLIACSNAPPWNGSGEAGSPVPSGSASASGGETGAPSGSGGSDSGSDDGGGSGSSGGSSSSGMLIVNSGDGGPCNACTTNDECKFSCASMRLMPGYLWCCVSSTCIMWSSTSCPMIGSGSGGGNSGSTSGGSTCGGDMQPCCSMDPACNMGLTCQNGMCG
jgi:hypothetical protein